MYHTLAYTTAIGTVVDTDVPALSDDIIQIQNNHFILPTPMFLFAAIVTSPTLLRARLVSPTLRQIATIFIRGGNQSAIGTNNPAIYNVQGGGTKMRPYEETQILGTANPGTTERFTAVLFAGDQPTPWPQGDLYPLRFTSTGTAGANVWTTIPITFTDVIPSGVYTMLISEHNSTNAIAHRWIISNQLWRPGFPSVVNSVQRLPDFLWQGELGVMGVFRSNDLPRLQVLCNAADAVHEGYLTVVRTGNLS